MTLSVRFQTVQGRDAAVLNGLPAPFAFERLPRAEILDAWRKRVGRYQTDTTDERFDFKLAELATESGIPVFKAVLVSIVLVAFGANPRGHILTLSIV